jgi:prolyl-tRNA editing enzyme YbaK/EbsC (Cys-tRNA(Pro) deacylase)
MTWSDPVERVAAFLRASGAEARLEEFPADARTAQSAADAAGCALDQIVTSLVFVCGERSLLVLVPGDRRADAAKVAAAAGWGDARVADPAEVVAATGFEQGGVSPLPPPVDARVFVERTVLSSPVVWVGAGTERHMARLAPTELVRLTRGVTVDLVQESA